MARIPVLEDLPDPAEKWVLVRATFDRPLAADPAEPLALRRAQGLVATIEWLLDRGAHVTVTGDTREGGASCLDHVRRCIEEVSTKDVSSVELVSTSEDPKAVGQLVERYELFVNDSLQDSLLPMPSLTVPARRLPSAAGRTLQHDLGLLEGLLLEPARPFVAVLGGGRSADRLHGLKGLVLRADTVLLGGALALPMLQALGKQPVVDSSEEFLWECRNVSGLARQVHHPIMLPLDLVWSGQGSMSVTPADVRGGDEVIDIGPTTRLRFAEVLAGAGSILWAGALGRVEERASSDGTRALAESLPSEATVVLGGDALVRLLHAENLVPSSVSFLSATDAAIELLKNGDLPALAVLRRE